jgi:hypothetical protein
MIVYTWDYHSSLPVWNGLRTLPILADEVQTFKALIVVHKLLQEGHPVVSGGSDRSTCGNVADQDERYSGGLDLERGSWTDGMVGNMRQDGRGRCYER